jgi:lipopolysaccharide biosynthesis glycosyltransferase
MPEKETIRICIGCEAKTEIPRKVLEFSIRKHLNPNFKVEFYPMMGESWINRSAATLGIGTGFSLQRWLIPEYFMFSGKAIYLDVDILCFDDIAEFWLIDETIHPDRHGNRASVYCTFQKDKFYERAPATSTMLIDCDLAREQWSLKTSEEITNHLKDDKNREKYVKLMHGGHCGKITEIPLKWNRFNTFFPEVNNQKQTSILHYTIEPKQPWYYPEHPHKDLWRDFLIEAIEAGVVSKAEIKAEVQKFKPHTNSSRGQGLHPYWLKFGRD